MSNSRLSRVALFSAVVLVAAVNARAATETVIHNFGGQPSDGAFPVYGSLLPGPGGALYGTTCCGGSSATSTATATARCFG